MNYIFVFQVLLSYQPMSYQISVSVSDIWFKIIKILDISISSPKPLSSRYLFGLVKIIQIQYIL